MILCIYFVLVALIGGLGPGQGNVYALNYETETFGPVCDDAWNMQGVRNIFSIFKWSRQNNLFF